ncbi:2-oxo acid dehydrogenase subunit E2 [Streptomyces sp. AJS327]|uniref:dihydrolipoamide acetyltransferase family protein n=1 Tax=Streptomyces sp. AJS327 TaxID=2545265 RepID=UPI0015DF0182|nr:dihydrolipoamide acetyltransferase family protein [Streptomyces sp. AJS327]MBA0052782.1 2-oxo acid dehydrogenase subunit E2 [Streptomyces sp. AJS327]
MAEVREFALPDLGEGLTEATVVRWLVAVGEVVSVDQSVVEVETAKALVDVPCPYAGVVTARYAAEGEEIPVGAPLVAVASGDAAGAGRAAGGGSGGGEAPEAAGPGGAGPGLPEAEHVGGSGNVLVGYGTRPGAGGRRRARLRADRRSGAVAEPVAAAVPGARAGGAAAYGGARGGAPGGNGGAPRAVPVISPLVRRLAREHGLDLSRVAGSGPSGLVLRADVERAVRGADAGVDAAPSDTAPGTAPVAGAAGAPLSGVASPGAEVRVPLTGFRGAVAAKLSRSRREIPDATCWVDADATELLAARRAMNDGGESPPISLLALLGRICVAALTRYPELNATVDPETQEIVQLPAVHLGFAAQTDRGLVVPVVRDAQARDAGQLTTELARLTERARAGSLTPGELTGGTFTLNNYGVFGVDGSTPILNHPEAAMLGVGRIAEKPWAHQGELALRRVVQLSFTFDHRVCDGGTAGGFLRYVADRVEQPALLLRTL